MRVMLSISSILITITLNAQNCCEFNLVKGESIVQLSNKYQKLKASRNKECCRDFGSGLMRIMEILSDSIDLNTNEERIIEIMGLPDKYATNEHPIEHHFTMLGKDEKILIYTWRGMHDFLYFLLVNDKLVSKRWYYALE
jgi:hypothetical protein